MAQSCMLYPFVFGITSKRNAILVYHMLQQERVQRIPEKKKNRRNAHDSNDGNDLVDFKLAKGECFLHIAHDAQGIVFVVSNLALYMIQPLAVDKMVLKSVFDPMEMRRDFAEQLLKHEWQYRNIKHEVQVLVIIFLLLYIVEVAHLSIESYLCLCQCAAFKLA